MKTHLWLNFRGVCMAISAHSGTKMALFGAKLGELGTNCPGPLLIRKKRKMPTFKYT